MPRKPDPEWIALKKEIELSKSKRELDERLNNERITKSVEILSEPIGARIEVNGEYMGDAPCKVEVVTNGYGKLIEKFWVTALPTQGGHYTQLNWFHKGDKAPARVFFNMRLGRSNPVIDVNIND